MMKLTTSGDYKVGYAIIFSKGRAMKKAERDINRKSRLLSYAEELGNVAKACRYFGIGRQSF